MRKKSTIVNYGQVVNYHIMVMPKSTSTTWAVVDICKICTALIQREGKGG